MGAVSGPEGVCVLYNDGYGEYGKYSSPDDFPVSNTRDLQETIASMKRESAEFQEQNNELKEAVKKVNKYTCALMLATSYEGTYEIKKIISIHSDRIKALKTKAPEGTLKIEALQIAGKENTILNETLQLWSQIERLATSHGAVKLS